MLKDPGTERHDVAALLGQGDELVRRDHATARVRPADERFESGGGAVAHLDDRLVPQGERVVGDGRVHARLEFVPGDEPGVELGVEEPPSLLARGLGRVEGEVGVAEEFLGMGAVEDGRDADAGRHGDRSVGEVEGLAQGVHDLGRQGLGVAGFARSLDEDGELVAAEPRRGVGEPQDRGETAGDGDEELVADGVPHGVVDDLEVVEVDEEHAGQGGFAAAPEQGPLDPLEEEDPVGEPGEGVVEGPVGQLAFQFPLLRHVTEGEDQAVDGVFVAQIAAADLDLQVRGAAVQQFPVVPGVDGGSGARVGQDAQCGGRVGGGDEVGQGVPGSSGRPNRDSAEGLA